MNFLSFFGRWFKPVLAPVVLGLGLAGCAQLSTPRVDVLEPSTVRPPQPQIPAVANGAIFQAAQHRPLFEDRRARNVGDVLTIVIAEKTSARQSSSSKVDRSGKIDAAISAAPLVNAGQLGRLNARGASSNSMNGSGETGSDNAFAGTITVTVVEVLANGNLVVSGDKQVGINQVVETLRFSGVISPVTILPGNTVNSTQVADARLQVRGRGDIDRAQTSGWLARFFMSFSPI
jgi:flagellar L-ring protein precursor FlgH